jgi:MFS family permease
MKYLEGNIFVNFYIFGAAGILAVLFGGIIYSKFGLRQSYLISFVMSILGCCGMLIIQTKVIHFDSDDERDKFDEKIMPMLILVLKMGIIHSFITTTQVSFTDDRIFPKDKRNTSVGSCGMIARSITIVAPIINEWEAPWPIVVLMAFSIIGLITTFTFPKEDEFADGEKIKEVKYDIGGRASLGKESDLSFHDLNLSQEINLQDKLDLNSYSSQD